MYHLQTQRFGLKDRVQFAEDDKKVGRKVKALVLERLRANVDAGVVGRWQEVLRIVTEKKSLLILVLMFCRHWD